VTRPFEAEVTSASGKSRWPADDREAMVEGRSEKVVTTLQRFERCRTR
jgi:hypothetical protein